MRIDSESMNTEEASAVWTRWGEDIDYLAADVHDLALWNEVFQRSMRLLGKYSSRRNAIYAWFVATYFRDTAVRIRKQWDDTKGVVSLYRLLKSISASPSVLNVERFTLGYPEHMRSVAPKEFEDLVGGRFEHITRAAVAADLNRISQLKANSNLYRLTNTRIAHASIRQPEPELPVWQEVHDTIREIESVCLKYRFLLRQVDVRPVHTSAIDELDDAIRAFWLGPESTPRPRNR
jgi:hypothetical protein